MDIPTEYILDPPVILRPVDQSSPQFLELLRAIETHGLIQALTVRAVRDGFELIDGFHRLTCLRLLGIQTAPCNVRYVSEEVALELQLQANICRKDMTRMEIAKQLLRIQKSKPDITLDQLATYAGKSSRWVSEQLNLFNLQDDIIKIVERGDIPIQNAYKLATLPARRQRAFLQQAQLLSPKEFKQVVADEIKKLSLGYAFRRDHPDFHPKPLLRPLREILTYKKHNFLTVDDAIQWVCMLDPETLTKRKKEYVERTRRIVS